MKCAMHTQRDAVGSCRDCNKGLCTECVNRFRIPLCVDCLKAFNRKHAWQLYAGFFITIVFFVLGFHLWYNMLNGFFFTALIIGLLAAGMYWGWLFLNTHLFKLQQGERTLGKKLLYGVIYYLFKLVLAVAVGVFVGPYQIIKMITQLNEVRSVRHSLQGIQHD